MSNQRCIQAIVAVANDWAIGRGGELLCHLPADLKHFKQVTMGGALVMGRKTFDSLPAGPLPGRQNIVVTHNANWRHDGVTVAYSIDEAMSAACADDVFVMGGAQIYQAALPLVQVIHLTHIHGIWPDADCYFPALDSKQWRVSAIERHTADERNAYDYDFITLTRTTSSL